MKKLLLLLLMGLYSMAGFTQQVRRCSTMEHLHQLEAADPTLVARRTLQEAVTRQWIDARQSGTQHSIINIPVVFHILYNDSTQRHC